MNMFIASIRDNCHKLSCMSSKTLDASSGTPRVRSFRWCRFRALCGGPQNGAADGVRGVEESREHGQGRAETAAFLTPYLCSIWCTQPQNDCLTPRTLAVSADFD